MKGKKVSELFQKTSTKVGSILLATAIVFGASMYALDSGNTVPELVTFVDTEDVIEIAEDETPLTAPKVTKSTKVTKKTKKIKLKKASKKTYSKKGKSTTKKKTATSKAGSTTTTTETVTATSILNKYKKGSKTQTRVTTTKTTVTKTVLTAASKPATSAGKTAANTGTSKPAASTVTVNSAAPRVDSRVSGAFNTLGFKIVINSGVSYSGLFDARTRTITLKQLDTTIYHELGHFVAFVAGNVDTSSAFQEVFNQEKSKYTAYNKSYVLSSSSEYFAESFKNYTENPASLQAQRPQTYAAIETALSKITSSQVSKLATVYASIWN